MEKNSENDLDGTLDEHQARAVRDLSKVTRQCLSNQRTEGLGRHLRFKHEDSRQSLTTFSPVVSQ